MHFPKKNYCDSLFEVVGCCNVWITGVITGAVFSIDTSIVTISLLPETLLISILQYFVGTGRELNIQLSARPYEVLQDGNEQCWLIYI